MIKINEYLDKFSDFDANCGIFLSTTRRTKRSMQYYRLWIYSCNAVLGVTSAVFAIFAAFVLADVRLSLLGGVELYHPTFLYAYLALILQCGVVQTIGCLGAQRLSHKLLSFYWILLLVLTIGDVVVGLVWVFKLDKVKHNLRPALSQEFLSKYSTDEAFTRSWDAIQAQDRCCGVDGPLDYQHLQGSQHHQLNSSILIVPDVLSLPESCCLLGIVGNDIDPVSGGGGGLNGLNPNNSGPGHTAQEERGASTFSGDGSRDRGWGPGWDGLRDSVFNFSGLEHDHSSMQGDAPAEESINSSRSGSSRKNNSEPEKKSPKHHVRHGGNHHHSHHEERSTSPKPPRSKGSGGRGKKLPFFSFKRPSENFLARVPFTCQRHPKRFHHPHSVSSPVPKNENSPAEGDDSVGKSEEPTQREFQSSSNESLRRKKRESPTDSDFLHGFLHASLEEGDNRNSPDPSNPSTTTTAIPQSQPSPSLLKTTAHQLGCGVKLIQWVDHVSGILFILGFCIIGFVKVCFLVILRTEIREMVEKIQILELELPTSPQRSNDVSRRIVSHPLLSHPHRASTVSAHAVNAALLPTIKSPEGSGGGVGRFTKNLAQQRRHSNIIGDRSSTHSQETVNMTLLVTGGGKEQSPPEVKQTRNRSNPNLCNFDMYDPVSITVPNTAKYLRRSSTCSASTQSYLHFEDYNRPGPSTRFHDPHHYALHHQQHCYHGYHTRPKLYTRNLSIGAVVHHGVGTSGGSVAAAAAATQAFRQQESHSGAESANCSFSSRDENEILSASMENVVVVGEGAGVEGEGEKERKEAEIRDWAAAVTKETALEEDKAGLNRSSDSASSGRNGNNNSVNVTIESIPLSYLGTAV